MTDLHSALHGRISGHIQTRLRVLRFNLDEQLVSLAGGDETPVATLIDTLELDFGIDLSDLAIPGLTIGRLIAVVTVRHDRVLEQHARRAA